MIKAIRADITTLNIGAIVNAANTSLLGGGGVDGAIHNAAGPELLAACRKIGGCPTGEVRITAGFALKARWIIHTVGPVWKGGGRDEASLLAACYENSLAVAVAHEISSIAFPAISTGAYAYPLNDATAIAIDIVRKFVDRDDHFKEIIFCCYSAEDFAVYNKMLSRVA